MNDAAAVAAVERVLVVPEGAVIPGLVSALLPVDLLASVEKNRGNSRSLATRLAYESDWGAFREWCARFGQVALPASPATVAAYITDRGEVRKVTGEWRYAPSTISRWLTSINVRHEADGYPAPGPSGVVREALAGISREHVRPTRRMAPLLLADLRLVLNGIDTHSYPAGVIGHRDALILLMGFAGAFRRSEVAARVLGDVSVHSEDGLHVLMLTSKTDQEGRGQVKALPFGENPITCPPCAFVRWVRVLAAIDGDRPALMRLLRESDSGKHVCQRPFPELARLDPASPLFRPVKKGARVGVTAISGEVVNDVVKRRLAAVGKNPANFGGHSLRAGFVTQAFRSGATTHEIMKQTGHVNPATVEIYDRQNNPLAQNAVTRIGL